MNQLHALLVDPQDLPSGLPDALRRLEIGVSQSLAGSVTSVLGTEEIDLVLCADAGRLSVMREVTSRAQPRPALVAVARWTPEEVANAVSTEFVAAVVSPEQEPHQLALTVVHWWMRRRVTPTTRHQPPNQRGPGMPRERDSRGLPREEEDWEPETGIRQLPRLTEEAPLPDVRASVPKAPSGRPLGRISLGTMKMSLPPDTVRDPQASLALQRDSDGPSGIGLDLEPATTSNSEAASGYRVNGEAAVVGGACHPRLALVDEDTTRADAVANALRSRGAWVHPLPADSRLLHWSLLRRFAPHMIVLNRSGAAPQRSQLLSALRGDGLLRHTPFQLFDYDKFFRPRDGAVNIEEIAPLLDGLARVEARLLEDLAKGSRVVLTFKQVPPGRLLQLLAACGHAVQMRFDRDRERLLWSMRGPLVGNATKTNVMGQPETLSPQAAFQWVLDPGHRQGRIHLEKAEPHEEHFNLLRLVELYWDGTTRAATPSRRGAAV